MIICQGCIESINSCIGAHQLYSSDILGTEMVLDSPVLPSIPLASKSSEVHLSEDKNSEINPSENRSSEINPKIESVRARKRARENEIMYSTEWTDEEMALIRAIIKDKSFSGVRYGFTITRQQLEDLFLRAPYCKLSVRSSDAVLKKINEELSIATPTEVPCPQDSVESNSRSTGPYSVETSGAPTRLDLLCNAADLMQHPQRSCNEQSRDNTSDIINENPAEEAPPLAHISQRSFQPSRFLKKKAKRGVLRKHSKC